MEQTASDTSACPTPDSKTLDSDSPLSSSSQLLINAMAQDIRAEKEAAPVVATEPEVPVEEKPNFPNPRAYKIRTANGRSIYTDKYTQEQKAFIVTMTAHFMEPREVEDAFYAKYGVQLHHASSLINVYKRTVKWKALLERERSAFLASMDEVPGFHKKVRMMRREKIYHRAIAKDELKYALAATKDSELEIEGPKRELAVTFNQFNQYTTMSDEELEEKRQEILEKMNRKKSIDITGGTNGSSG